MSKKQKKESLALFDEEAEEAEAEEAADSRGQLAVNKNYADRYNNWRGKEEMQKLKDKYGDVGLDENSAEEEESESETEDEDAQELTKDVELEFFRALSLLKSKDQKIYDKENTKFFEGMENRNGNEDGDEDGDEDGNELKKGSRKKPYQLKDLEREMVLKRMADTANGVSIDEDYEEAGELERDRQLRSQSGKKSYFEEQEDIKRSLKKAMGSAGSDEDEEDASGLLKVKEKSKEQAEREEAEYIEWFKGQKADIGDQEIKKNMGTLHDFWTDPALPESEKFLRDYILNKRYIGGEEESGSDADEVKKEETEEAKKATATATATATLDFVGLSDEEKIIENQEEFERKYNFRFEEPDPEFIKAYPRTIQDSMRREKTKRREKREETKKRKELERTQRREEIKRLKNLKRLEIVDKLERLKKVAGVTGGKPGGKSKGLAGLSEQDLEADFDPEEYERRMQELFDDDYYGEAEDKEDNEDNEDNEKPVFTDDEDEDLKVLNWDQWETEEKPKLEEERKLSKKERKALKKKRKEQAEAELEDPEFDMDAEPEQEAVAAAGSKKMSKLAKALLKKKPVFDPAGDKSFEEYFDEYYQLDCEDVIGGDLPCRFKYREVVPNDFGLDLEEIFGAKDQELNQWASLKKTTQYRPIKDEVNDVRVYKSKRNQMELKKRILSSLYAPVEEEEEAESEVEEEVEEEVEKAEDAEGMEEEVEAVVAEEAVQSDEKKKKAKKRKRDHKELVEPVVEAAAVVESNETRSKKSKRQQQSKPKKNKNILESMSADRLQAYGIEPKKFHKKLKYGGGGKEADQKASSTAS